LISVDLSCQDKKGLLRQVIGIPRIAGHHQGGAMNPHKILLGDFTNIELVHRADPSIGSLGGRQQTAWQA
jgi:hypothetical protein